MSEDEDVSAAVSAALAASGVQIVENAGAIDRFERSPSGVRLIIPRTAPRTASRPRSPWSRLAGSQTRPGSNLDRAGVRTDRRGYVEVDSQLRTSAPHIFAAGDVTGHAMVVHEAIREGVRWPRPTLCSEPATPLPAEVSPIGSFTDPEYASVGLTEAAARERPRSGRRDGAVRLATATDHRRPPDRVLQTDRRSTTPQHPRLPHRRRTRGRARAAGGDRDGRRRCPSSNSHSSRIRFQRTRTRSGARLSPPQSNSTRPEGGRSSTSQTQSEASPPQARRRRTTNSRPSLLIRLS